MLYGNAAGSINLNTMQDFTNLPKKSIEYKKKRMILFINNAKEIIMESICYYIRMKKNIDRLKKRKEFASLILNVLMRIIFL